MMTSKDARKLYAKIEAGTANGLDCLSLVFFEIVWACRMAMRPVAPAQSIWDLPIARALWEADNK